ncbi:glucosaminidase domain-containing protein [Peptoniphilus sp. MSJ-1]|uniref:Glucosaminidase domain-containing protein n=1 Tax=Peptoniphilus ovalis TaxID=2841503 RepID=A0ABS6FGZ1_9FIRM|nr:glucosaminidase domain-containing protein [Peptoniphilus ovalis]MBU5668490.1 glucosaminidase domain-containing protein [Peptoniphilus ovalis]
MKAFKTGCGCISIIALFFIALFAISIFVNILKTRDNEGLKNLNYREEYLESTKEVATKTAKRYGLFPSVMLAQSVLESNWGRSELSKKYNNYFGIKEIKKGEGVVYETEEYVDGESGRYLESFKKYSSKQESFEHYAKLLTKADRYKEVKKATNYTEAAHSIMKAGYATDPKYANKIISVIEKYNLQELDN